MEYGATVAKGQSLFGAAYTISTVLTGGKGRNHCDARCICVCFQLSKRNNQINSVTSSIYVYFEIAEKSLVLSKCCIQ
jgi:hypothetical protein